MKYRRLPQFLRDWQTLSERERYLVKEWLQTVLLPAVEEYEKNPANFVWPAKLRFEKLVDEAGVFAVTWSFSGPDGRATFHFETVAGECQLVWRRIGHHSIYQRP